MSEPLWDVFHSERLEAEKSLTARAIRDALGRGGLVEDDLIRPSGEARWTRVGESPEFADFLRSDPVPPELSGAVLPPTDSYHDKDDAESDLSRFEADPELPGSMFDELGGSASARRDPESAPPGSSDVSFPVLADEDFDKPDLPELDDSWSEGHPEAFMDQEDEADGDEEEFTLSRNSTERVEELDLAAMVDVAFQLVLFFLVTAQVVLYKTLEVPRPNEDKPPEAAAQGRTKSVDELEKDYILVEVDAAGAIKIDRQPVPANRSTLVEKLRASRESTARKAMLLSADFETRHENAVLVFDVANEIDLKIAIAQPSGRK